MGNQTSIRDAHQKIKYSCLKLAQRAMKISPPHPLIKTFRGRLYPLPLRGCVAIPILSLRATAGSVAITLFSKCYQIASVASLPRNDIVTQSLKGGEGRVRGYFQGKPSRAFSSQRRMKIPLIPFLQRGR